MKQLLSILLLVRITTTAYAEKNAKASKVKHLRAVQQPVADTVWHGTGKEHYEYGTRSYDPRTARYGYVDIDSAIAAKYGATSPTLPKRNNEAQAK